VCVYSDFVYAKIDINYVVCELSNSGCVCVLLRENKTDYLMVVLFLNYLIIISLFEYDF